MLKKIYLEPHLNENSAKYRKQTLIPYLSNLFVKHGGCGLISVRYMVTETGIPTLRLGDFRSRIYKAQTKKKTNIVEYNTSSARPLGSEHTCGFYFPLYFEPDAGRWYFYEHGMGYRFHRHHLPKDFCEVKKQSAHADPNELDITSDALDQHLSSSAMAVLLEARTDDLLSAHQLRYQQKKRAQERGTAPTSDSTVADRLISQLEESSDTSYIVLTAEVETVQDLMTVTKKRSKKSKTKVTLKVCHGKKEITSEVDGILSDISSNPENKEETPEDKARKIYDALKITGKSFLVWHLRT